MKKSDDFLLRSPLCSKKMWFSGAHAHKKYKHPGVSGKEFEIAIIEAVENGIIKPKIFPEPQKGFVTATNRMRDPQNHNKTGIDSVVRGGKME